MPVRSSNGRISSIETAPGQCHSDLARDLGLNGLVGRQRMLRLARLVEDQAHELRSLQFAVEAELSEKLVRNRSIHVVAAELAVATGGADLEYAVIEQQDRHVERAAPEVVDRERAVPLLLEAVGQRGRRRLVDQAKDLEPREARGILRRLPLRVVEISGNGNDGAPHAAELVLGLRLESAQNLGADLDGRHRAASRHLEPNGIRLTGFRIHEDVWAQAACLGVVGAAPHEALHAHDRVAGVLAGERGGPPADDDVAVRQVGDDAGDERLEIAILNRARMLVGDVGDERVGRAQIDPDGTRSGFGIEDLEKCH